jgi:surface antigen
MTITFDDLPSAAEETKWVPNKYNGFNWTKIVYMEKSYAMETYPKSGYVSSFMPGGSSHIAFFNEEAVISSEESNETFTLVSLTACAAWNDNLHLTISGYRNSIQVNTHTSTLIFGKPQVIILLWRNIDKITFQPSGGTLHQANKELESDTHCILTQLTIN